MRNEKVGRYAAGQAYFIQGQEWRVALNPAF